MVDLAGWKSSVRGVTALFALGMVGVVALAVASVPTLREIPELSTLSYPILLTLAAANSMLLLIVFIVLGAVTAPRIGLQSHVFVWAATGTAEWGDIPDSLPFAAAVDSGLFVVAVLDVAFAQFTQFPANVTLNRYGGSERSLRVGSDAAVLRGHHGGAYSWDSH